MAEEAGKVDRGMPAETGERPYFRKPSTVDSMVSTSETMAHEERDVT